MSLWRLNVDTKVQKLSAEGSTLPSSNNTFTFKTLMIFLFLSNENMSHDDTHSVYVSVLTCFFDGEIIVCRGIDPWIF